MHHRPVNGPTASYVRVDARREQVRESEGGGGLLDTVSRGIRTAGDMASGRKSVTEGIQDAADLLGPGIIEDISLRRQ